MYRSWVPLVALLVCLVFFPPLAQADDDSTLRIGGGGAAITSIFMPIADTFRAESGITLTLHPSNPLRGLSSLAAGDLDIATGLASLEHLRDEAVKAGKDLDFGSFQEFTIATTQLKVFVDKNNPLKSLSKEQLQGIFSGRIGNWKEVGGKDMPITLVWGKNTPGINQIFTTAIMNDEPVTGQRLDAFNYSDIRLKVRNTPGAIGIDPIGFKDQSIATPSIPKIDCSVYAITKGEPSQAARRLMDFIAKNPIPAN